MKSNKLSTIQNLCNQGNVAKSNKSSLLQYNHIVMIGLEHLSKSSQDIVKNIPISINVSKAGELEITGLDKDIINNRDSMRIYTEKKVTRSKK
ncbi:hypothetical protein [Wukongibacter sp. M2B1]|uniref:hypothetical protein n=1 Tax=Wukongibacter sp. M2B1 TaxID=3088895 RepID=UPI003D79FCB9